MALLRRLLIPTAALIAATAAAVPAAASADTYLPPSGKVWAGIAAGDSISEFESQVGKHPAVWQHFVQWGSIGNALPRSNAANTRAMLHLSTAAGQNQPGVISPGAIARGKGDDFLLRLGDQLAEHDAPVYLRLMGEMNNCDNAYSPMYCNRRSRGADNSPTAFKRAWKRMVLIVRGGDVATINAKLRKLGMPAVRGADTGDELPAPRVAVVWSPMTGGSPMIPALRPQAFWPGADYVDWVGTSFYSKFPTWQYLNPYYRDFAERYKKPFAFAEWAIWGGDNPAFVRSLFTWVRSHKRVRLMTYNQGYRTNGPFRLKQFPKARQEIRRGLQAPIFAPLAPEHSM